MPLIDLSADLGPTTEPMMVQLDDDALPPGTVIGGCQIVESLSSDGMSILYLANDSTLQRHVLIREHFPSRLVVRQRGGPLALRGGADKVARADALEAFLQEGRLLVRLDHPSIAKVHRFWEQNQTAYMMMPFYQGQTLAGMLKSMNEPAGEAWLRKLLASLLGALKVLHGADCFHLAISPDSIWMTPDGRPMLLDLSAANKVVGERGAAAADSVDRSYAPIEQFSYGAEFPIGPWTDLYAVAAVVHQAILGRPPTSAAILGADDSLAPLSEGLQTRGPRHARLVYSPAFLSAIDKALSVKPQDRPQTAAAFEAALDQAALAAGHSRAANDSSGRDNPPAAADTPADGAPNAAIPTETTLPTPGPDGLPEGAGADPAAAAAIALAISSLPWVGRTEPTLDRQDVSMHQVLLHEDGSAASPPRRPSPPVPPQAVQSPREPLFEPVAPSTSSEDLWARPPSAAVNRSAAPAAPPASRPGRWALAAVLVLTGLAGLGWYASQDPMVYGLIAQWTGHAAPAVQARVEVPTPPPAAASAVGTVAPAEAGDDALQPAQAAEPAVAAASAAAPVAPVAAAAVPAPAPVTAAAPAPSAEALAEAEPDQSVANPKKAPEAAVKPQAAAVATRPAHRTAPAAAARFNPEALPPTAPGPATPRGVCGSRTNFALNYCMQTQCKRPGFSKHPQCIVFHRDGEVR